MTFTARFLPMIKSSLSAGDGIEVTTEYGDYVVSLRDDVLSLTGSGGVTVEGEGWEYTIGLPDTLITLESSHGIEIDGEDRNFVARLADDAVVGSQGVSVENVTDGFAARLDFEPLPDGGSPNSHSDYLIAAQNPTTGDIYKFLLPQTPPSGLPAVKLSDYGVNGAAFTAAWNAVPASGGILYLPPGDVTSPGNLPAKTNVWLIGSGSCLVRDDNLGFVQNSGTRILGQLTLSDCDNFHGGGFSVDAGAAYLGAGAATDAFVFQRSNPSTPGQTAVKAPRLWDISGICKGVGSGDHAVLIQHVINAQITNVRGHLGQFGVVYKGTYGTLTSLKGYLSAIAPVILKSDNYAPCEHNKIFDTFATTGSAATCAIAIHATTAQMNGNHFFGIRTIGGSAGISIFGGTRVQATTNRLYGLIIDGFDVQEADDYGIQYVGGTNMNFLSNGKINATASNRALWTDDETLGIDITNVVCSVPADQADNVRLGGLFCIDNLKVIVNDNVAAPGTIQFNPEFLSVCRIGSYIGKSNYDGSSSQLINGWTDYATQKPKQRFENDTGILSGVIQAPVSRSSTAVMNLLAAPVETQTFTVLAQNTTTGQAFAVTAEVTAGGQLLLPMFTGAFDTAGWWPAAALAVNLGNIRYRTR